MTSLVPRKKRPPARQTAYRQPCADHADCTIDRLVHQILVVDDAVEASLSPAAPDEGSGPSVHDVDEERALVVDVRTALVLAAGAASTVDLRRIDPLLDTR